MKTVKLERISDMLVEQISYIINREVKDKDIEFVTVTECKVSSDLSYAKVYVTVLNDAKRKETIKALNNAKGFIRGKLHDRVDIRHIPELEFVYDESIEYGQNIEKIIEQIHDKIDE